MVRMKEARTTLYKLFEKKYICLQARPHAKTVNIGRLTT
jgi:hypothetical protein|eukprot:COSAG01_NODE_3450_length_6083_cov_3.770555_3_plen_39_part_00